MEFDCCLPLPVMCSYLNFWNNPHSTGAASNLPLAVKTLSVLFLQNRTVIHTNSGWFYLYEGRGRCRRFVSHNKGDLSRRQLPYENNLQCCSAARLLLAALRPFYPAPILYLCVFQPLLPEQKKYRRHLADYSFLRGMFFPFGNGFCADLFVFSSQSCGNA